MSPQDPTPGLFSQLSISQTSNSISLTNGPPSAHHHQQQRYHQPHRQLIQSESMQSGMSLETLEDERMPMSGERSGSRSRYSGDRVDHGDEDDEDGDHEGEDDDDDEFEQERKTRASDHLGGNGYGAVDGKGNGHLKGANSNGFQLPRRTAAPKGIVHVEVRLNPYQALQTPQIRSIVRQYISENFERAEPGAEVEGWEEVEVLRGCAERIVFAESTLPDPFPLLSEVKLVVHVYQPSNHTGIQEFAATTGDEDDDEDNVMAATVQELPSRSLDGLWESLIYTEDIKPRLLNYIYTTLLFSDADVDFNIITWNRVVLLHGPPGTGKTSLCRALAQKLAIRLSERYARGRLVEINSHSLFSKWFSESGKLVQKLFARVNEMVEDESGFVVVLIDEVESLTAARAGAMSGTEPSDALRVVNALLTQLDKLKHRKNVLVMSTSNIAQAIDSAFVDRADIKQYIGLPPPEANHWILTGCLNEMMKRGLMENINLLDWKTCDKVREKPAKQSNLERVRQASLRLARISEACQGMSGRTLRRLPVLSYARYMVSLSLAHPAFDDPEADEGAPNRPGYAVEDWLDALERVVKDEGAQKEALERLVGTGGV
ncbi:hypothetical protein FFLO_04671 [Filobasidium floriforme]|uniref:AAA+ ATPase domain-containing protein n=1 Tax=Filobasidium floriforme TaxID=5210 RepID=A0A8K0JIS3_9TREE|nr:hypothetical protein FFLO_04671 [Filobasidium floriforme]